MHGPAMHHLSVMLASLVGLSSVQTGAYSRLSYGCSKGEIIETLVLPGFAQRRVQQPITVRLLGMCGGYVAADPAPCEAVKLSSEQ